ncbi:hypothetical protein Kisp01_10530 [Kineosporia sp. NBRC 101677]|uniref:transglutaminase family protein n=1 Tax=Kineosporia sp. NBRC 101677 TaxID=3032197 RepID=UPI0024A48BF7|nr:transglutaminase domain-containing protein [Kineosporia sp. NBRC 101677]GLY14037.1 hypothetical protein Kisp01_10530 [Kineosporia sp. NBRC 101677]
MNEIRNVPTLLTLVSAALALGLAGLLPGAVCLLVMVLVVLVGVFVPTRFPQLTETSWGRSSVAGAALALVVGATAATSPQNLLTGTASSPLAGAADVLAVPQGLPLGMLAALAAGSLIAVTLEIGHRRGTQSALVLGTAVLGLACVAAPSGLRLLVPIVIGWPAALLALTKLNFLAAPNPDVRTTVIRRGAGPVASTESALAAVFRWRIVPVLLAIVLSSGLALAAGGAEFRNLGNGNASAADQSEGNNARAWETKFLGGRMDLNSRGPLGDYPVAEIPLESPSHWRTATLDSYNGVGWQVTGTSNLRTTLTPSASGVRLSTSGDDTANLTAGQAEGQAEDQAEDTDPDNNLDATETPDPSQSSPDLTDPFADPEDDFTNPADPGDLGIEGLGSDGGASTLDGGDTQLGSTRTDQVVNRGNGPAQLIAPGRVLTADLPSSYAERTFVSPGERVVMPSQNEDQYRVTSQVYPDISNPAALEGAADDAVADPDALIDPRYLQVPDTLPARVRDLGEQLVGGATTRLAAVQAVGTRLRQSMSYTLDAPVPPSGADAVDFALFESHQGFCEHYASAAVMLLRSGGIPARMVVGYLAEGKESIGDDRQLIRQAQAHAWAEVWFPGAGWVTFESTPAGGLDESFLDDLNSAFNRAMNDLAERFSAFVAGVVGPVVLGVVLLVIWLFRRFLLRQLARLVARVTGRRKIVDADPPYDPDLRKAFLELESELAAQGAARAANETLQSLRDRLLGPRYYTAPEQKHALEGAFDVLNRALYSRTPPDRDECLQAAAAFEQEAVRLREAAENGQPVVSLGQSAQLM